MEAYCPNGESGMFFIMSYIAQIGSDWPNDVILIIFPLVRVPSSTDYFPENSTPNL